MCLDLLVTIVCLSLAGRLNLPFFDALSLLWVGLAAGSLSILLFWSLGLYNELVRFFSGEALAKCVAIAMVVAVGCFLLLNWEQDDYRGRFLFDFWLLLTVGWTAPRVLLKLFAERLVSNAGAPVFIYGAGEAGRELLKVIDSGNSYRVLGFLDDKRTRIGKVINGRKVFGREEGLRRAKSLGVKTFLLAVPSASTERRREIVLSLVSAGVSLLSIPPLAELSQANSRNYAVSRVRLDDLLGRGIVEPKSELLAEGAKGKRVLVTGAGGSIGGEICRQLLEHGAAKVVMLDSSEIALYKIDQELTGICERDDLETRTRAVLCSVSADNVIARALKDEPIDVVYHAAAYKHVPMVEDNPLVGLENNVFGSLNTANWALKHGVDRFVLVSTDKAVRPTNIMGASKRLSEILVQQATSGSNMAVSIVRFGNVLGSSGSVVPRFKQQLESGGPLTLTHLAVTRYFMTVSEAASLVIQAGAMGKDGNVFLLEMGKPMKLLELAKTLISLAGYQPLVDERPRASHEVEIKTVGLRPGEKLYEELLVDGTALETQHPRIFLSGESPVVFDVDLVLGRLRALLDGGDANVVRNYLNGLGIGYQSECSISEADVTVSGE
ncbi:MAG: nucleoside-diphosphate sugar epimerase/dehydratase [Gammaproteobacteria bacterium]|nr:nucleoside-diphosphate sugar epimerase/dehydratase [Gammaproteobacteria bacterium]